MIDSLNTSPATQNAALMAMQSTMNRLKFSLACCFLPSPRRFPMSALPPMAIICPTAMVKTRTGASMLIAERASVLIRFDASAESTRL